MPSAPTVPDRNERFPSDFPLVLASVSPRRSELLARLGVSFVVVPASVEECSSEMLTAWEVAKWNAYRKARNVARTLENSIVLGSDTVVCLGTRLFGKPSSIADASAMLHDLQGKDHEVVTAICLLESLSGYCRITADTTRVRFKSLNHDAISAYHQAVNPLDKAGGYGIQDCGDQIIESIDGSFTNVMGLPIELLSLELNRLALWYRFERANRLSIGGSTKPKQQE